MRDPSSNASVSDITRDPRQEQVGTRSLGSNRVACDVPRSALRGRIGESSGKG